MRRQLMILKQMFTIINPSGAMHLYTSTIDDMQK